MIGQWKIIMGLVVGGLLMGGLKDLVRQKNLIKFETTNFGLRFADPAGEIIKGQKSRIQDRYGKGQYGASRDKGKRVHAGLDVVANSGEKVYAPFEGDITGEAVPYKDDLSYRGLVIKGSGEWVAHVVKIFYVEGLLTGHVTKGQEIGTVQDLLKRYPGITNHIHVEVRAAGTLIDPFELWQYSF
jgi:hypothetical protein